MLLGRESNVCEEFEPPSSKDLWVTRAETGDFVKKSPVVYSESKNAVFNRSKLIVSLSVTKCQEIMQNGPEDAGYNADFTENQRTKTCAGQDTVTQQNARHS